MRSSISFFLISYIILCLVVYNNIELMRGHEVSVSDKDINQFLRMTVDAPLVRRSDFFDLLKSVCSCEVRPAASGGLTPYPFPFTSPSKLFRPAQRPT